MVERGGVHRILEMPWVYTAFQTAVYRAGASQQMKQLLYPELGGRPLRVLDIGCGPAAFFARYSDAERFSYVGIEPNASYVRDARAQFPGIELHGGTVPEVRDRITGSFDLVVLEGVLHHIDDETAIEALAFAAERLTPGGRLVALDPVLLERQHPVARALARLDRGKHVRSLEGYRALAVGPFRQELVNVSVVSGLLRVPYDQAFLEVAAV